MIEYILAFLDGVAVKIADWLEDEKKDKSPVKLFFGVGYGIILGYLVSVSPFSALFFAALVAQVFAGKIDEVAHRLGLGIAVVTIAFFGLPQMDYSMFIYFLVLACLDEMEFAGIFGVLSENRLFLLVGSLPMIVLRPGGWVYPAGILAFDI